MFVYAVSFHSGRSDAGMRVAVPAIAADTIVVETPESQQSSRSRARGVIVSEERNK